MRAYEVPQPRGNEVLVQVKACGVCHSDLHLWSGYYDLGGGKRIALADRGAVLPFTMGHEVVGRIVAAGPDADPSVVGRNGVVFPWIGCGQCDPCSRGMELMCETPRTIGTRKNGGYSYAGAGSEIRRRVRHRRCQARGYGRLLWPYSLQRYQEVAGP
jgi:D-arabinose 1-dehydrogenase-like Zn-dependent alcohol dehydrogenase